MKRVTMKDVAAVTGVSVMTVSNAFNRPDQLSAEVRARILARAAKMGYTGPNATARQLRSGRTNCFAVVFRERLSHAFADPFSSLWLTAFAEVMEQHRASMVLLSVPAGDTTARQAVQDTSVDGFAGLCPDTEGIRAARERGLPTVVCTLHESVRTADEDFVAIDDYTAGQDAVAHLRQLGHRRIDLLLYEEGLPSAEPVAFSPDGFERATAHIASGHVDSWQRLRGALDALADLQTRIIDAPGARPADGRRAAAAVLDHPDPPSAVVALSDALAIGFMDGCADRGLAPGADVSVIGFDDVPAAAAAGLTSISQPIADKGRLAAELLLDPQRPDRQIILPHRLVVRSSTRPAGRPAR